MFLIRAFLRFVLVYGIAFAGSASAATPLMPAYGPGNELTPERALELLGVQVPPAALGRGRGIVYRATPRRDERSTISVGNSTPRRLDVAGVPGGESPGATTASGATRSPAAGIDVLLQFDYNSARILPGWTQSLDAVAIAMAHPSLAAKVLTIEGHADPRGSAEYNLALSLRRARVVAEYLSRNHGLAMSRLRVVGKGESELLDQQNPYSAMNRRVRFVP